jgi:hypothetical protein
MLERERLARQPPQPGTTRSPTGCATARMGGRAWSAHRLDERSRLIDWIRAAATRPAPETTEPAPSRSPGRLVRPRVEPERRVGVGHQTGVGDDAEDPAVQAEHQVVERAGVAGGEQQRDAREEHEQPDQPATRRVEPAVSAARPGRPGTAGEDRDDQVLRDRASCGRRPRPAPCWGQSAGAVCLRRVVIRRYRRWRSMAGRATCLASARPVAWATSWRPYSRSLTCRKVHARARRAHGAHARRAASGVARGGSRLGAPHPHHTHGATTWGLTSRVAAQPTVPDRAHAGKRTRMSARVRDRRAAYSPGGSPVGHGLALRLRETPGGRGSVSAQCGCELIARLGDGKARALAMGMAWSTTLA